MTGGYYLNWLNMPYNDLSKPWWLGGINDNMQVGDAIYVAVGDTCLTTLTLTFGVFYNRTRGEDYGYNETIYQTIRDGEWTLDVFESMVKDVYEDTNGNGMVNMGDIFGGTSGHLGGLKVGMGAESIRELLMAVDLDKESAMELCKSAKISFY